MAPLLLPITVLALGGQGPPPLPALEPPVAGAYRGTTDQDEGVTVRVRPGGRTASWRIRYRGRCDDGYDIRGGFRSGGGVPLVRLDRGGSFRLISTEPAPFRRGGTGTARLEFSGRLGPEGGSGRWRIDVKPPRAGVTCTSGPVRWGVARG